jgi:D-alanyl-D-alanine carboxypeptidase
VLTALFAAVPAGAAPPLEPLLNRALAVPHVSLAASAAVVLDLETGQSVYRHNESLSLLPASNEKLAVTYAALTALGPAFRIETTVLGAGEQAGSVFEGDLVLKGYGDPTLSAGIARVTGRVVGDESWFDTRRTAPGWKAAFYIFESPPLSALIVDRGRIGRTTSHDPALAAAQLFRSALARAGVRVGGEAGHGTAATPRSRSHPSSRRRCRGSCARWTR